MALDPHSGLFYPDAVPYKRVYLSDTPKSKLTFMGRFWTDDVGDGELIAPPDVVQAAIEDTYGIPDDLSITSIESPDPTKYPPYMAHRIRGNLPVVVHYADELTPIDPRFVAHNHNLHFAPDSTTVEEWEADKTETMFGEPMPLDMYREALSHGLNDLNWDGKEENPSPIEFYQLGQAIADEYSVRVTFSGDLWSPQGDYPHGIVGVSSIYVWPDEVTEPLVEECRDWFVNTTRMDIPPCHDFTVYEADDTMDGFISAWWD